MPLALAEKKESHYVVFDIKKTFSNANIPIKKQKDKRPTYSLKLAELAELADLNFFFVSPLELC